MYRAYVNALLANLLPVRLEHRPHVTQAITLSLIDVNVLFSFPLRMRVSSFVSEKTSQTDDETCGRKTRLLLPEWKELEAG